MIFEGREYRFNAPTGEWYDLLAVPNDGSAVLNVDTLRLMPMKNVGKGGKYRGVRELGGKERHFEAHYYAALFWGAPLMSSTHFTRSHACVFFACPLPPGLLASWLP